MGHYMNFLFNPNGRVSRKDIWLKYFLVSIIASTIAGLIDMVIGFADTGPFGTLVSLFFFWPAIAVSDLSIWGSW